MKTQLLTYANSVHRATRSISLLAHALLEYPAGRETPVYREKCNGVDGNRIPFRLNGKTFCFTLFWKMLKIYLGFHVHEGYG